MPAEIDALQYYGIGDSVKPIETTLASAATIAPQSQITLVTGTTAVATITPPWPGFAGRLDLIFTDGSPAATVTTGNIAIATTVVSKKALSMIYSQINGKWYPSY
jgi:hypothetical protein